MKTTQKILITFVIIFSFAGSCSNDDDPPITTNKTNCLIVGTWKFSGSTYYGVDVYNLPSTSFEIGTNGQDIYGYETCYKDDVVIFTDNNAFIQDAGANKCNTTDPQTKTNAYFINANQTQITFNITNTPAFISEVLILNATTLKINNGGERTETFTRQ